MSKQIEFGSEARAKLVAGIDKLADAVVATMGPSSEGNYVRRRCRRFRSPNGKTSSH